MTRNLPSTNRMLSTINAVVHNKPADTIEKLYSNHYKKPKTN